MLDEFRARGFSTENLVRVARDTEGARMQALRAFMFLLAGRVTPFLGVEQDGVRYVLSSREPTGVCFPTFVRGFFEEEKVCNMVAALALHAGTTTIEGATVLEIGANIGTETVSLLVRHGVKRVIAVEPDSENVRFLRANLALNGVQERADVHEMALSDFDGTAVLERDEDNWGDHRVRVADVRGPDLHDEQLRVTSEVPAWRLDSLIEAGTIDLDAIDLVWMDAQGHEGHILNGAKLLMALGTPAVTEYWPYGLHRVDALERFHALIAEYYGWVVDLREPAVALAAEDVAELADRYTTHDELDSTIRYTDLLLLPRV